MLINIFQHHGELRKLQGKKVSRHLRARHDMFGCSFFGSCFLQKSQLDFCRFRQELGHSETALELSVLLSEAVRLEEPNVSLAIVLPRIRTESPSEGMD